LALHTKILHTQPLLPQLNRLLPNLIRVIG
jgi:hypothetical protein